MTITDERLAEIAAQDVREAIMDTIHNRLGHSEQLGDEPELGNATEEELVAIIERYEKQLSRYLGEGEPLAHEDTIRAALINFSWSNYGLDEVEEADGEWAQFLATEIAKALVMAEQAQQLKPPTPVAHHSI